MVMKKQTGGEVFTVEALDWDNQEGSILLGIYWPQVQARANRGLRYSLGQLYGIVEPGAIIANHIYKGLNRAMYINGDSKADKTKIVYCLSPSRDYKLSGDKFSPTLKELDCPENCVFVIIVSPNEELTNFPDIKGWIEHWSWVDACPNDPTAPVENDTRYAKEIK